MTDQQSRDEQLQETGRCAYASIAEMVDALECDYDRLAELREERDDWQPEDDQPEDWAEANPDEAEELAELDHNCEPSTAVLEVQDWFLPWTEYTEASAAYLLAYAGVFYYGEGE